MTHPVGRRLARRAPRRLNGSDAPRGPQCCFFACACASTSASAADAGPSASCGRIGFEPQSDNVGVNIRARGTSCRRARRIVRAVYNGNREPFGYRCRSRLHDEGVLSFRHWLCTKNLARVTWDKY